MTEERGSSEPAFRVNSPTLNPFVVPGPVAIVESEDHFDLEWIDEGDVTPTASATQVAEEFVARSSREAQLHSSSPRAWTNLGVALLTAHRGPEAMQAFGEALARDPNHYAALAHLARLRLVQDDLSEAERLATILRERFPRDAVARMMLGWVALRRGNADQAIQDITVAAKLDPGSALPNYLLGMVFLGTQRTRDAVAYLRKATRLDERSPTLQRGLGVAYAASGELSRAVRALRISVALDPGAPESVHALGRILIQRGDGQAAVDALSVFVDRNPRDLVGQELLAQGYRTVGDHRAAKRQLQKALENLEMDDSPECSEVRARLMNNIGAACASASAFGEAERWYARALEAAPHSITFRNLFGIYAERQQPEAERRILKQWLEVFPDDEEAALRVAIQLTESGEVASGIGALRRLTESHTVAERACAALGYALADFQGEMRAAMEVLEEGYERFQGDAGIANNLAYVYLRSGMGTEAREVLERVAREDVEASVYLTATWGLLLLCEGDVDGARREYDSAARLAERKGAGLLAQTVRQKMRLELARHYLGAGDGQRGVAEIEMGLAIGGRRRYAEELRELRGRVRALGWQSGSRTLSDTTEDP